MHSIIHGHEAPVVHFLSQTHLNWVQKSAAGQTVVDLAKLPVTTLSGLRVRRRILGRDRMMAALRAWMLHIKKEWDAEASDSDAVDYTDF